MLSFCHAQNRVPSIQERRQKAAFHITIRWCSADHVASHRYPSTVVACLRPSSDLGCRTHSFLPFPLTPTLRPSPTLPGDEISASSPSLRTVVPALAACFPHVRSHLRSLALSLPALPAARLLAHPSASHPTPSCSRHRALPCPAPVVRGLNSGENVLDGFLSIFS